MRRRFAPLASLLLAVSAVAAACGGSSGGDAYDLLYKAIDSDRDPVQVNVGFALTDGSMSVEIDSSQIGFVMDKEGGSGAVHVSIPVDSLGADASVLTDLGFTGDAIDLDVVFDGEALYARSPLVGSLLEALLAETGGLPDGDLGGWLRFGTEAELSGLMEALGGTAALPSSSFPPAGNAGELKSSLEGAGITLKNEGREDHNGVDSNHISVAIDVEKLLASEYLESADAGSLESARTTLSELDLDINLWLEASSGHLAEIDVNAASTTNSDQTAELTLRFRDPDGSIPTDAPDDFVELPITELVEDLLPMLLGGGMLGL
ncbi:MAG: hypothetical protein EPO36_02110 [Chloroflexota bacterium]|nr:MAG: hypothetical protein EPO36_02110 [Chloroflexota bacterium]